MKMSFKKWMVLAVAAVCSMGFQSCLDDDDNDAYYLTIPNALVTVKPTSENAFFLQLDDTTTLLPVNMTSSPFGSKEVRALTNFSEVNEPSEGYSKAVHINWIDSILTKNIAPDLGAKNDSIYGKDPVEIVGDWVTIAEDGYLTLRFRTATSFGEMGDGLVAFKLDSLPDTEGKTVKLKLKWNSYSGEKSAEFNYCSRKSTPASASIASERATLSLE